MRADGEENQRRKARRSLVLGHGWLALPAHRKRDAARVLLGLLLDLDDRLTHLIGSARAGGGDSDSRGGEGDRLEESGSRS